MDSELLAKCVYTFQTIKNWKIISVPSKVFYQKIVRDIGKRNGTCMYVMVELAEIWYYGTLNKADTI